MSLTCAKYAKDHPKLAENWAAEWTRVQRNEGGRFPPVMQVARTYCQDINASTDDVFSETDWNFIDSENPAHILELEGDAIVDSSEGYIKRDQ